MLSCIGLGFDLTKVYLNNYHLFRTLDGNDKTSVPAVMNMYSNYYWESVLSLFNDPRVIKQAEYWTSHRMRSLRRKTVIQLHLGRLIIADPGFRHAS